MPVSVASGTPYTTAIGGYIACQLTDRPCYETCICTVVITEAQNRIVSWSARTFTTT